MDISTEISLIYVATAAWVVCVPLVAYQLRKRSGAWRARGTSERAFHQDILNAIAEPVFIKGAYRQWHDGNTAFWRLVSCSPGDLIGSRRVDMFSESSIPSLNKHEDLVLKRGFTNISEEEIILADGSTMRAMITRAPLTLPDGKPGLVGVIHDVTHQKTIERELKEHKNNLQRLVDEQTTALTEALAEAQTVSHLKSDFLSNMSHELRTPLNSIIGMAELVLEGELSDDQHEMMITLGAASKNLLEIVNDILDLSKIESGSLELENIPFDAQQVISEIISMLEPLARRKGIELDWNDHHVGPVFIKGDPLRYARIITNLISNAVKYTDEGQVEVALNHMSIGGPYCVLTATVNDSGVGIAEDAMDKIFDKFTQADSSTTRKYGGTGLGLAITKQLIDKMNGAISVDSELGVGSTFTVRIPFERCEAIEYSERPSLETVQCGTISSDQAHVLVAEDHPLNQIFICKLLESIGIKHIHMVENGVDVVDFVDSNHPDVVLMDCHMPKMNGYDATKAIRNLGDEREHIPIVAMTANAMTGERERCLEVGMDDYISKPVNKTLLINILAQWLRFDPSVLGQKKQPANSNQAATNPMLDLTSIKRFSGGDDEMTCEFVDIFTRQSTQQLQKLDALTVDGPSKEWVETAHLLKGGAATMGAMQMREICATAQEMLEASTRERQVIHNKIEQSFLLVKQELTKQHLLRA